MQQRKTKHKLMFFSEKFLKNLFLDELWPSIYSIIIERRILRPSRLHRNYFEVSYCSVSVSNGERFSDTRPRRTVSALHMTKRLLPEAWLGVPGHENMFNNHSIRLVRPDLSAYWPID